MTAHNVTKIAPAGKPAARPLPPPQPLPRAVIDPARPLLKLGLDVHLESITAVVQKDHANPHAPRPFTNDQLLAQVQRWIAEGFQVFCVQESCGFGFTLHRRLVEAGAQSFLITPVALNGARKTDKLDARALCLRLSRWLDGNRDELAPIRIPTEAEQRRRETTRRRQFLAREIRALANRGHGQVAEYPAEGNLPVQALRIGDVCIGTMPCEVFCEIGLDFRKRSPIKNSFLVSLAHGYYGYLPTPRHHDLGGYETWLGTNRVERTASEKFTNEVLRLAGEMKP